MAREDLEQLVLLGAKPELSRAADDAALSPLTVGALGLPVVLGVPLLFCRVNNLATAKAMACWLLVHSVMNSHSSESLPVCVYGSVSAVRTMIVVIWWVICT